MSLLLCGEIRPIETIPDFGAALHEHLRKKTNPAVHAASVAAWSLLADGLRMLGLEALPEVRFDPSGKPRFTDSPLHFSLSHSGRLAAVLISDAPCGVDVEQLRPEVAARLHERCLSDVERARSCDFFELWTKKECIAKLDGSGMRNHPSEINTLDACWNHRFFTTRICDSAGQEYVLSALCWDAETLTIIKNGTEALDCSPSNRQRNKGPVIE
ncbi:MAG: 4'-phosphopantetheinyl transferase superfamily protein, partial [Clostridia bacterium]|nr:4'-phosphopantetheinyl transferase superfamily protein [Clostridia bacterium]